MNGQRFDTRRYPKLAQKYPSGQLPDMRGEFIRGLDNGRGVDAGRGMLSAQSDAIRNITGDIGFYSNGAFTYLSKVFYGERKNNILGSTSTNSGEYYSFATFDASRVVPTANENRPRNIAYHYICLAE